MVYVPKEDLHGYRVPTEFELNNILQYLTRKIRIELRPMKFWTAVCSVIAGSGIITIFNRPTQYRFGTLLVMVIITVASVICIIGIRKSKSYKRNLLKQTGAFNCRVMDCKVYHVSFNMELNSQAVVKVYNSVGQYCVDKFLIDIESARVCQAEPEKPILLFNCNDYYELMSDKRMEVK